MKSFEFPRSPSTFLVALALFAASGVAHAEERDPAAAQALFDEAKKLSAAGKYPEACAKLAESNRLDPGIGTQFHLADCQEKSGRIASAWANFLEVASQARSTGQGDRERASLKRAAALESRLPKLRVDVPEANRAPGLEIRRDGALVGSAQWGTPVPVDPGEHELIATAPGKRTLSQKVRAEVGKTNTLVLPPLEAEPVSENQASAAPQTFVAADATGSSTATTSAAEPKGDGGPEAKGTNPLVYVLAGAGVVGLGIGTTFALMANSTNDDSMVDCRPEDPNRCNARGVDVREKAQTQGNIASVGFIAGGAALAGAGALLLFGGNSQARSSSTAIRPSAELGPGRAALYVRGTF